MKSWRAESHGCAPGPQGRMGSESGTPTKVPGRVHRVGCAAAKESRVGRVPMLRVIPYRRLEPPGISTGRCGLRPLPLRDNLPQRRAPRPFPLSALALSRLFTKFS